MQTYQNPAKPAPSPPISAIVALARLTELKKWLIPENICIISTCIIISGGNLCCLDL